MISSYRKLKKWFVSMPEIKDKVIGKIIIPKKMKFDSTNIDPDFCCTLRLEKEFKLVSLTIKDIFEPENMISTTPMQTYQDALNYLIDCLDEIKQKQEYLKKNNIEDVRIKALAQLELTLTNAFNLVRETYFK